MVYMGNHIDAFILYLHNMKKTSENTEMSYRRDLYKVQVFMENRGIGDVNNITKDDLNAYVESMEAQKFAASTISRNIASLKAFFHYLVKEEIVTEDIAEELKAPKIEKKIPEILTMDEVIRLLDQPKGDSPKEIRDKAMLELLYATGIRVSEIKFITVNSVKTGEAEINCKGKMRRVFLPKQLCRMLKEYIRENNIKSGYVFVTRNGQPLDRSNIWSDMKKLCKMAGVSKDKVFPHNLRHLFARTYYSIQKDIVRLADILGHSSVNTTRIYTIETGEIHRRQIQKLGLLKC